jgi:hypothetical protein
MSNEYVMGMLALMFLMMMWMTETGLFNPETGIFAP